MKPVDAHPPEIVLSSLEGYVKENSPIGEEVLDATGTPLLVQVEDKDFVRCFLEKCVNLQLKLITGT